MPLDEAEMAEALRRLKDDLPTGNYTAACLALGFLPVPIHFYHPIPDIDDLIARDVWRQPSELAGVDFRPDEQLRLLAELGGRFGDECNWPATAEPESNAFYTQNYSFSFGCAGSTHFMIRQHRPRRVIEIGSGMSSRVIAAALEVNGSGEHIIVDPYPVDPAVTQRPHAVTTVVKERVELLDHSFFAELEEGDILFIDSGHVARIGGDVNFLFLEVIPRLKPGVIVHVHDIGMPEEFPRCYVESRTPMFWTEQYLLQAFLAFNSEFEVLLAMAFLQGRHPEAFRSAFSHFDPTVHNLGSGSFWMRRKPLAVSGSGEHRQGRSIR